MNKWRLLLFSVFGLLQITTSDRNFIDGRCCEHSSRYSEPDTRISINEPYRVNRISPDLETRKSSETRPRTRAQELRSFSRRDINSREHLRRTNDHHQSFERQRIRESINDLQMIQRRDSSRERVLEYSRNKRDNTQQERSIKNGDGVFPKDSRSEVASRDNNRHNDERERFGNNGIRQDDGFDYHRRFARNFGDDRMSINGKFENNPQKRERRISETSRIAKRLENRNTIRQHLFNDEAPKTEEIRYQSEKDIENDEVRNTRNGRYVREYRNKEDSFIENRIRSNTRSRNNKRRINRRGLTERNIRLNERSVSDEHLNYVRDSILSDENIIRNNRQRVAERNLIMSRRSISEEPQRYREENREREMKQKNINENRIREDSRNSNREDLRRNRELKFETRRDNLERALEKDSATIRVTRRDTHDFEDDVRDINRENRFSQRTSQIRRQNTRLETSNMIERHIRNSREFRQIQDRKRRNLKGSRNVRMTVRRDNGQIKEKADASLERRVSNIDSEERGRVHTDDKRGRNFIQYDIRRNREQDRESSRMRSNSASRRINLDRATDDINEQLRQARLQNTQERRDTRRQDRDVSRARNVSASRRYNVLNMVNEESQSIKSRSVEERSIRRQTRDKSVRSNTLTNSYNFLNILDENRQLNRYSRDNRDESRIRNVRILNNVENCEEERRSRTRPSLEKLSIRRNDRNILRSRSTDLLNRYTINSRDNVRDEVRSGDIENSLSRYSRDTQARQNIRRDNRDELRIRSVRVLSDIENRKEHRSRFQPSLQRLSIRKNDRNVLRSRSADLPNRYTTSNSRYNVRDEVRSDDIDKSLSNKRASTDIRTRSTPILRTFRTNKNNEESRRTATQNTLRLTRRIGSEEFEISTRSLQTYISQNGRNEASRRIRSRSLTTERRTENRQVRINRDRSLNKMSTRIEHDDKRLDIRRVPLTRSTLFAENVRDIPITQKTTASYIFEMKWQYIFYALQGIYICSLFLKMPRNHGKKQLRITNWLTPVNFMKID